MGKIIDELRQDRQMSREDLCEEVMSVRNYQRFVAEEVNVSNDKLGKLIDKLSLDYFTVREISRHRGEGKYTKIHHVYQLMQSNSDQQAYKELTAINRNKIESSYMTTFYDYLKIDLERQLKIMSQEDAIRNLISLINYPEILNFKVLNFIELNVLVILNLHFSKLEDDTIAKFLYKFLLEDNLEEKGLNEAFLPSLYSATAQSLGTFTRYTQSLEICNKGISECMKLKMFTTFHQLLFFKALSHMKLDQKDEMIITLKRLYTLLYTLNEDEKTKEYIDTIKTVFNIELTVTFGETS